MALTKKKKTFLYTFLAVYFVIGLTFAIFNAQKRKLVDSPDQKRLAEIRRTEIYDKLKLAETKYKQNIELTDDQVNKIYETIYGVSPDNDSQEQPLKELRLNMVSETFRRERGMTTHEDAKVIYNVLYGAKQDDPDKDSRTQKIQAFIETEGVTPTEEQIQKIYGAVYGPKLGPIAINFTMIMQMLNFAALATILYVLLWGPLIKFLDDRKKKVADEMTAAEKEKAEAEKLHQEYRQRLRDARDDAAKLVEEGRRRGEDKEREIIDDARKKAERIKEHAHAELAAAEVAARKELRKEFAAVSVGIAEKILSREIKDADQASLVEQALAGLEKEGVKFE
jgi:F-type H+-transporting ATPase subunit b